MQRRGGIHNHPLPGLQTRADDPFAALHGNRLHSAGFGFVAGIDQHDLGRAIGQMRNGALRQSIRLWQRQPRRVHAHIHAGQEQPVRIGKFAAQQDLSRAALDADIAEQQAALALLAFSFNADAQGRCAGFAGGSLLAQLQGGGHGLLEIGIHGIQLLDHGQRRGFILTDQRTFSDQGAANAATDGGGDAGIAQIQACRIDIGLRHAACGLGHLQCGLGGIVFLAADSFDLNQFAVALQPCSGIEKIRLGARQCAFGVGQRGTQRGGVDLKQLLPGLDLAAFFKMALQQNAGHSRPHFGAAHGLDAAGQGGGYRVCCCLYREHINRCWRWRPVGLIAAVL